MGQVLVETLPDLGIETYGFSRKLVVGCEDIVLLPSRIFEEVEKHARVEQESFEACVADELVSGRRVLE
jgi:hypothetical protein